MQGYQESTKAVLPHPLPSPSSPYPISPHHPTPARQQAGQSARPPVRPRLTALVILPLPSINPFFHPLILSILFICICLIPSHLIYLPYPFVSFLFFPSWLVFSSDLLHGDHVFCHSSPLFRFTFHASLFVPPLYLFSLCTGFSFL